MGPDGIHLRVLRELAEELAKPLSIIYQRSWLTGEVPDGWRLANVTPIDKKGREEDPGNYRPVSLTSAPGKIMQRFILSALNRHVQANQGFRPSQHGFTQGRSCLTNLISSYDQEPLHGGGAGGTLLRSTPSSAGQGPAKWRKKATEAARTVFSLACRAAGALVSLWSHLLSTCVFTTHKMALQKKRFLKVVFLLLPLALAGVYCGTSLPVWTMRAKGLIEELTCASAAQLRILRNSHALLAEQTQKMQLLLEEVAQLTAEIRSGKKEVWGVNQAVSDMASKSTSRRLTGP
ncbi:uncharacterized protein [Ciconia boyciana]|uniref:uncharacterized protein n=1 Tax=Ciconia boyciana TaxID=52775 RepID=UPI003BA215CE